MTYGTEPGATGGLGGHGTPPGEGHAGEGFPPSAPDPYGRPPRSGLAVATLVLGVAGLIMCGLPALFGAITGHLALRHIRRTDAGGRGMALTGLTLSYFALFIWIITVFVLQALSSFGPPPAGV
ncbi:hypothetical protein Pth03_23930 [Planotetraspora thailandica]|uniref:DUF4190 domain-containing protein n=1 Tax=Planotetraspora thailandica TaxID=487172 RepID=A0A8J3XV77_9ACTN|nr:DUF4190 domain-containing protein [Planotetraspora thailandica]GII54004.1 hypothetical protein Pth03_23930 [Planotetraspora thailandica]